MMPSLWIMPQLLLGRTQPLYSTGQLPSLVMHCPTASQLLGLLFQRALETGRARSPVLVVIYANSTHAKPATKLVRGRDRPLAFYFQLLVCHYSVSY